ncbi:hypothetical protein ASPFODRAFT_148508, partial [Aspergillus luchuensis CBS 106.47]
RAPATPVERTLQQLWAKVLNIPAHTIGMDDSFFRLGGDSIAAMRLAGVARQDGFLLTVSDVFNHPSLSELACTMRRVSSNPVIAATPESFSLLDVADPVAFIHAHVTLPYAWPSGEIVDAFPTTQLQTDFILSQQCTYFLLDIPGVVDLDRLQDAVRALSRWHPIMRSIFFTSPGGVIQGIVRSAPLEIPRHTCSTDILQFSRNLCREDSKTPLSFGVLPFRVSLVSADRHHVLILRLSHAQYDGLCLPVLYRDLAAAYRGDAIAQPPTFSCYMQYRLSRKSTEAFQFWRGFLRGATMTRLDYRALGGVDRTSSTEPTNAVTVAKNIPLPSLPPGITMATVVKAAWSFVLAQLTRQTDIVFGQTVNGRSVPIPDVESILGPCINAVPVRVTFQPAWTVLDLLQHTQDQYTRVLPFETSDLRDIIKQSTDWSEATRFEIMVQHDNISMNAPFTLAGIECNPSAVAFQDPTFFAVHSESAGDHLALQIAAPNTMVSSVTASKILDDLCQTIVSFTHDSSQVLLLRH